MQENMPLSPPPTVAGPDRRGLPVAAGLALAIALAVSFLAFLGSVPLLEPDEGRYAEIPREMLARDDFVTPRLNGVKYFEKPPLLYWLNALSLATLGETEFAARLPTALAALAGVLWTWHAGRKVFGPRAGAFAALVLGTSIGYAVHGKINIIDPLLTTCLTVCLGSFLIASRPGEPRAGRYHLLAWAAAALAVLAKGLIGMVLPGGVVAAYILATRRWRLLREMRPVAGLALFLLIAAPWFVVVSIRNPEFPDFFFINEHFRRFTTTDHGRWEPPYFFLYILPGLFLPWTFFLPEAGAAAWARRREPGADARLFLALWAGMILAFFSASSSKLIPYVLPVLPALALLIGDHLAAGPGAGGRPWKLTGWLLAAAGLLAGPAIPIVDGYLTRRPLLPPGGGWVLGGAVAAGGLAALVAARRGSRPFLLASVAGSWLLLSVLIGPFAMDGYAERKPTKELGLLARTLTGEGDIVACQGYKHGFAFYSRRRLTVLGGRGELEFGSLQGDVSKWFPTPSDFIRLWDSDRRTFLFLDEEDLDKYLGGARTRPVIVGREGDRVLVSNRGGSP
jgi:4-amino-4-deoxy-L-arabinose transferase-like glycosyltransferase